MSLPPQFIKVKVRKRDRDDEGVVDFLRVDGVNKRHQSNNYLYQHQRRDQTSQEDVESGAGHYTAPQGPPVIHTSKPGDEDRPLENVASPQRANRNAPSTTFGTDVAALPAVPAAAQKAPSTTAREPRRFHMARPSLTPTPPSTLGRVSKRRHITPAVFVERTAKKKRLQDALNQTTADFETSIGSTQAPREGMDVEMAAPRRLKKPGSDRKTPLAAKTTVSTPKKEIPKSMQKDWAADMDDVAQNMDQFVLQHIGENLARIEARDKQEAAATAKKPSVTTPSKFKPRAPALRYAERHPEVAAAQKPDPEDTIMDDSDSANEDDYVIETYIRVPVTSLGSAIAPEKIGLLVFDTEPDASFFYGEEGDSDDEWAEDDEDENAENYYTADYPDDEVDSDDEYGRDPYQYRDGNASDLEEFDDDDEGDAYVVDNGDEPSQFSKFIASREL